MENKRLPEALSKYTLQQLQLELLRRSKGNEIVAWLLEHHSLWTAVILDEIELAGYQMSDCRVPNLDKLLSTAFNHWSADYLYILTPDRRWAEQLRESGAERKFWRLNEVFVYDEVSSRTMLGSSEYGYVMVASLLMMRWQK